MSRSEQPARRSAVAAVTALTAQILQVRRRSLLIWSLSLAASIVLMLAIFPSVTSAIDYSEMIRQYPENLKKAFGIGDVAALGTAVGYLQLELFGFILPIAIVFLPTGFVSHAVTQAEERGYLESLLSLPLPRWQLAVASALAAASALAVALLAMFGAALATAWIGGISLDTGDMGRSCLSLWPLSSLFAVIALVVACAAPRVERPTAVAAGLLIVMYLMNVVAGLASSLRSLEDFSIFHYYDAWLKSGSELGAAVVVIAACLVLTVVAALLFERRDVGG